MFRGIFTALVTPFRDGGIDTPALEQLVDGQIAAGITGLIVNGTTGESPTLTADEREQNIQVVMQRAAGRCQILAGTGSNSTASAIGATLAVERLGVDGALVVAPYYNKPSQEGLFRHFAAIAENTKLPIMLYNIPGRCAVDIAAATVDRLARECPNIVSIKEASGSVDRVSELRGRVPEKFTVLSGDDSLTLPFMSVGAVGVVSVASNIFPQEVADLVRAFLAGNFAVAQKFHARLLPMFKDLFIEPNPVPAKTVLNWRGEMLPEVRLPLCEMTEANAKQLRRTLDLFERSAA